MDHIANYIQKIISSFQGGSGISISAFVADHLRAKPILHPNAQKPQPDMSALIYSLLRLPPEILEAQTVVMGQSDTVFKNARLPVDNKNWADTKAAARARKCKYNAKTKTLALFIASMSDVEDLVTILTAFYIEVLKLEKLIKQKSDLKKCFKPDAYIKIEEILGTRLPQFVRLAKNPTAYNVRVLNGSYLEYAKATQEWWINIAASRKKHAINIYNQPVYFVSSNSHSLINMLSGFAIKEKKRVFELNKDRLQQATAEFKKEGVSEENICYYLSRFTEKLDPAYKKQKQMWQLSHGLISLPPFHHIDIEAQIFPLKECAANPYVDKRLGIGPDLKKILRKSNALILNIAYPLGLSAYNILKEVSENVSDLRGVYIMGKAASLNAGVGDITLPHYVFDSHTGNEIFIENNISAGDVAPFFPKNSIFSRQKAVSVHGTFLQNERSLGDMYKKGYSIIEMEAGPYLERVYEMLAPNRYPNKETILIKTPFRLGLAYYVSDTPYDKGVNLGSKRLTWEGLNATYGISGAILSDIIKTETARIKNS